MLRIFLYFAVCMLGVHGWNTLYSYTDGKVYLHLSNNDLVSLNFSITGTDKDVEITDNQQVQTLTLPPQNLTLFLVGENLFGVTGDSKGDLSLVEYVQDNWKSYPLNLSELNDASFYNNPTVLSDPNENQTVYVYGGEGHDTVSSRMVSIEMSTLKVSNISRQLLLNHFQELQMSLHQTHRTNWSSEDKVTPVYGSTCINWRRGTQIRDGPSNK